MWTRILTLLFLLIAKPLFSKSAGILIVQMAGKVARRNQFNLALIRREDWHFMYREFLKFHVLRVFSKFEICFWSFLLCTVYAEHQSIKLLNYSRAISNSRKQSPGCNGTVFQPCACCVVVGIECVCTNVFQRWGTSSVRTWLRSGRWTTRRSQWSSLWRVSVSCSARASCRGETPDSCSTRLISSPESSTSMLRAFRA